MYFLNNLPFFSGSLFVFTLLTVAWFAAYSWLHRRQHFFLACYLFLLLAAWIGYRISTQVGYGWWLGITGSLFNLLLIALLSRKVALPAGNRKLLRLFLVISAVILIGSVSLFFSYQNYRHNRLSSQASLNLLIQENRLNQSIGQAEEASRALAGNQEIIGALQRQQNASLEEILQEASQKHRLEFLILAAPYATVIAPENLSILNGKMETNPPWIDTLMAGQSVKGLAYNEEDLPIAIAGTPVASQGKLLGALLAGFRLGPEYVREESEKSTDAVAIANEGGIITSYSNWKNQGEALSSPEFNQFLTEYVRNAQSSFALSIRYGNSSFLLNGKNLPTLTPGRRLTIITLSDEPAP